MDPHEPGASFVQALEAAASKVAPCGGCKEYFILDGGDSCISCAVQAVARPPAAGVCPVCQESVMTDDATVCCNAPAHRMCLDQWVTSSTHTKAARTGGSGTAGAATCPLCRKPGGGHVRAAAAVA